MRMESIDLTNVYHETFNVLKFHYYKSFIICLTVDIKFPFIRNLKIVNRKDLELDEKVLEQKLKDSGIQALEKDAKEQKISFDSRDQGFESYSTAMYLVVNKDVGMGKGKIAGQTGHVVQHLIKPLFF